MCLKCSMKSGLSIKKLQSVRSVFFAGVKWVFWYTCWSFGAAAVRWIRDRWRRTCVMAERWSACGAQTRGWWRLMTPRPWGCWDWWRREDRAVMGEALHSHATETKLKGRQIVLAVTLNCVFSPPPHPFLSRYCCRVSSVFPLYWSVLSICRSVPDNSE